MDNRIIKFRVYDTELKDWIWNIGMKTKNVLCDGTEKGRFHIMQFTGLQDSKGVDIYEGDILQWYGFGRYTQQSHPDIMPEIDELYLKKKTGTVVFKDGAFQIDSYVGEYIIPINEIGIYDVDYAKGECGCVDDESCDINGNEINEEILGIEVIGNIHQNANLLTQSDNGTNED